eukprot:11765426-Alexandrium_andersonii.AAC.1
MRHSAARDRGIRAAGENTGSAPAQAARGTGPAPDLPVEALEGRRRCPHRPGPWTRRGRPRS